jgi:ribosomal protein S18 acetylase RimI-like enzyme
MEIVPYSEDWLAELIPMWRASFEAAVGVVDPHPVEEQRSYFLEQVLPHNQVVLALVKRQLAGFIAFSSESVDQLYVRAGYQGSGIGSRLLALAKNNAAGSLSLYTFARNSGARAFYEKQGFVIESRGHEPHWGLDDIRYRWTAG